MPELPEVQTVVNDLKNDSLIGLTITQADLFWEKTLAAPSLENFNHQIVGQKVLDVTRRGKWIVIKLQDYSLLIHLRMSGRILLAKPKRPAAHERARFQLSDGRVIRFEDQRKFGRIYLLADPEEKLGDLGVEPLSPEFTAEKLQSILRKNTRIKPLLLDQTLIAGLGNIYVDEALFRSSIYPETPASSLTSSQIEVLQKSIRYVLQSAIELKGTSLGEGKANFHGANGDHGKNVTNLCVYGRDGLPCFKCQTTLLKIVVAGRGTHFCPNCQNPL